MAQGIIYTVDGTGLRRMTPSAPESENRMQELVARYPELITDGDGDLLLIKREQAIGDGKSDGRWSIDHLFVTREAVPVLVELKRASDTRIKREVVGQLIDYAANASAHWAAGTIAASFAQTVSAGEADAQLATFIGDRNPDEFWAQVDANLTAGRLKLVFVADVIPRELAIVVEFLNAQMRAEVRAVELRWFADDAGLVTLTPRIIGESAQASVAKAAGRQPEIGVDSWIDEKIGGFGPDKIDGVRRFCAIAADAGGNVFIPSTRGSIMATWPTDDGKFVYPFGIYPSGMVVLRLGYLKHRPAFVDEEARRYLYDELVTIVGPLHTSSLAGEPGFAAERLTDLGKAAAFASFLADVVAVGRRQPGDA